MVGQPERCLFFFSSTMLARIHILSFLSIITLPLAVNAYKSHLQQGKNHNHHELAAAVTAAGLQCRPRIRSSAAVDSAIQSSAPLAKAAPAVSSISASKLVTSFIARPSSTSAPLSSSTSVSYPLAQVTSNTSTSTIASSTEYAHATPAANDLAVAKVADTLTSSLTPNSIKAGIAGGDAYNYVKDHIGWWYDWSPTPSKAGKPIGVPMLWGGGTVDATDAARLAAFQRLTVVPMYVLGFEEPDCSPGSGSSGMTVDAGVAKWEKYMAPLKAKGAKLGSPSMCKQADETWLAEFAKKIKTPWDITCIHINKNSLDGMKKDVDHYAKYNKPIWVTEFACVADNPSFVPCTNQAQINKFIQDAVSYFEGNNTIYAYAYSNGLGLGNVWPMTTSDGKLSASGKTYLDTISKYH